MPHSLPLIAGCSSSRGSTEREVERGREGEGERGEEKRSLRGLPEKKPRKEHTGCHLTGETAAAAQVS